MPAPSVLDDDVAAGPAVEDVLSRAAEEHVVARLPAQRVVTGTADEDVVPVAPGLREPDPRGLEAAAEDDVVAREGIDRQRVVGLLGVRDVHPGREAEDAYGAVGA